MNMMNPKPERMSDAEEKRKRKYVAALGCLVCGQLSQAHHMLRAPGKGMGIKADGRWLLPLCPTHHRGLHLSGNETKYLQGFGIDGAVEAVRIQQEWERANGR